MAQLSLYRRYRPRRFSEIRGQDHVVRALRNAVATGSESHAYLFSGPRGTGKTSTARIFAKALNCEALAEGEPCGGCESCLAIDAGRSFDLFELDAASNNGVDAVRDLVERAAVGSPGRTKVYILDEVHMLTAAASNALLKTLEEPPDHVRFVLATTDPQKVLPTIRSRTQHYEFQLLSAEELEAYVRWIAEDVPLDLDDAAVAHVVRQGRGSARDTLSALDQVVAAGGVLVRAEPVEQLFDALAAHDTAMAVSAVADALTQGHDPRVLGEAFVGELRDAFLLSVGAGVPHLVPADRERLEGRATAMGTPVLARAMEALGTALVEMRQAADPRIPLEVALVGLTTGAGSGAAAGADSAEDTRLAALTARVERLEARLRDLGGRTDEPVTPTRGPTSSRPPAPPSPKAPAPEAVREPIGRPSAAAPSASEQRSDRAARSAAPPPPPRRRPEAEDAGSVDAPAPRGGPGGDGPPDRDAVVMAFGDHIVGRLKGIPKALYSAGRFVAVEDGVAVLALDNAPTRDRAEQYRGEVEALLASHFGTAVALRLVTEQEVARSGEGGDRRSRPGRSGPDGSPGATGSTPSDAGTSGPSGTAPAAAQAARPPGRRPPSPPARGRREPERSPERGARRNPSSEPPPSGAAGGEGTATESPPGSAGEVRAGRVPKPPPQAVAVAEVEDEELLIDLSELEDASAVATSGLDKLTAAFPGSELLEEGGDG